MNKDYVSKVNAFLQTFLEKDGYSLIKTEFVQEDGQYYLRSYIDLTEEEYGRRLKLLTEAPDEETGEAETAAEEASEDGMAEDVQAADAAAEDVSEEETLLENETALEPGIDINDCVKVSRKLSKWLDQKDFIKEMYTLEVCSKGFLDSTNEEGETK